jgi:DNA-binding IclR family transcriptional regulator
VTDADAIPCSEVPVALEAVNSRRETPRPVGVLTKALAVLRALEAGPGDVSLKEIARRAGLDKATCHRILGTLVADDIAEVGAVPGTYRLGIRLLELGKTVQRRINLRERAAPVLAQLGFETEESILLAILRNDRALYIEVLQGAFVDVSGVRVGDTLPLHVGAAPRALLAALPDEHIHAVLRQPLPSFTEHTPATPDAVWRIVHETRARGYALSDQDIIAGVTAVGAPIYDHTGGVAGSISIAGSVDRLTPERKPALIAKVVAGAEKISRLMGYRGAYPAPPYER